MLEKIKNQRKIKPASLSQACWRANRKILKGKHKMIDIVIFEEIRNLRQKGNTLQFIKDYILEKYNLKRSLEMIRRYCINIGSDFVDFDRKMGKGGNKTNHHINVNHPWKFLN